MSSKGWDGLGNTYGYPGMTQITYHVIAHAQMLRRSQPATSHASRGGSHTESVFAESTQKLLGYVFRSGFWSSKTTCLSLVTFRKNDWPTSHPIDIVVVLYFGPRCPWGSRNDLLQPSHSPGAWLTGNQLHQFYFNLLLPFDTIRNLPQYPL